MVKELIMYAFISWENPGATPFDPWPEILINYEVRRAIPIINVKLNADVKKGDPVTIEMIEYVNGFELKNEYHERAFVFMAAVHGGYQIKWQLKPPWSAAPEAALLARAAEIETQNKKPGGASEAPTSGVLFNDSK